MAERRMFAKSIVLSDAFLDMPPTARCLYFTLNMFADDDGFVGNPKAIMRQCQASDDDIRILLAKRYILAFESGVIVIKHWRINNYLQNDRHKNTTYIEEKETLTLDEKGAYTERAKQECIQSVYSLYTQDSIGKESIDKDIKERNKKREKKTFSPPTIEEAKEYIDQNGYKVDAEKFVTFYQQKGWMVGKNPMKDWKAAIRHWNTTEKSETRSGGSFDTDDFFNAAVQRTRRLNET